ncbi:MAG: shikimate dehydrogenase [Bacteroidales bacterium]
MKKFGLIGYPLEHSFSKKYFSEKFTKENITDCTYDNYPLEDIHMLPALISSEPNLSGLNVTIPHKSLVISYLDHIDPEASQIGAVNVIKIKRSGAAINLSGFNSDIFGITETLASLPVSSFKQALVLGTGGSSKAVCHVLGKINVPYTLISRSPKPGCMTYRELTPGLMADTGLIINTTPLGMYPQIAGKPEIRYDLLNHNHILFDLVYNPEITEFLRLGQERGCRVLTGIRMLYSQAWKSWEIWNDDNY